MKIRNCFVAGLALILSSGIAYAQEEEESKGFTYATYLYCDTNTEGAMDKQVNEFEKPILDKLVDIILVENGAEFDGLVPILFKARSTE
jgi:hypothetical protein